MANLFANLNVFKVNNPISVDVVLVSLIFVNFEGIQHTIQHVIRVFLLITLNTHHIGMLLNLFLSLKVLLSTFDFDLLFKCFIIFETHFAPLAFNFVNLSEHNNE